MVNYFLNKESIEELKNELEELKKKRITISERIQEAKGFGDLSENSEYQEAKDSWAFNEGRIQELEEIIRNAQVVEKPKTSDMVRIGSTIRVRGGGKDEVYTIVDSRESDPPTNKLSIESPLGKAFSGKKAGESVEVKTPKGVIQYKIIKIS